MPELEMPEPAESELDAIDDRLMVVERLVVMLFAHRLSEHPDPLAELEVEDAGWQELLATRAAAIGARLAALDPPPPPERTAAMLADRLDLLDARHTQILGRVRALLHR